MPNAPPTIVLNLPEAEWGLAIIQPDGGIRLVSSSPGWLPLLNGKEATY